MDRFYEELKGENEETLDRILASYKESFSRIAWKHMQRGCKWDERTVFTPNNTRFYYRKSNAEIIVQEFSPQTRLIKIGSKEDYKSYSLAFPYVVFIFKFVDGVFVLLNCAFLERPIKDFKDIPANPYLSNITNFEVCLGTDFNYDRLVKDDLTQQCAYVLDFFWDSVFSTAHGTYCSQYQRHFENTDFRMVSWEAWEEASGKDPYFVIEDVDWIKSDCYNFGDLIAFNLKDVGDEITKLTFEDFSEKILKKIKESVLENVVKVRERMEK